MHRFFFLIFCFLVIGISPVRADETALREEFSIQVADLFWKREFGQLEEMADTFRREQSRTPSGLWKLRMLYRGVNGVIGSPPASDDRWNKVLLMVDEWIGQHPRSPTPHIVKAKFLLIIAGKIRGDSMAKDVPEGAWEPFFKTVKQAGAYLMKVKDFADQDPEWYESMVSVASSLNLTDGSFDALVKEGLDKHPTYYPLYFNIAYYWLPKWHGDRHKIEELANEAVERTQSTDGMGMYARIYWYVSSTYYGGTIFTDSDVSWPKMKRGIEDVLKQYPDQWNLNNFAYFACMAKDRSFTKELMSRIETPDISGFKNHQGVYLYCKNFAEAKE
jgi:hypothetical protein